MPELFEVVVVSGSFAAASPADGHAHADSAILRRLITGLDRPTADAWARSFNRAERRRPYGVRAEARTQLTLAPHLAESPAQCAPPPAAQGAAPPWRQTA